MNTIIIWVATHTGLSQRMAKVALLVSGAILVILIMMMLIWSHDRRVITEYETDTTGRLTRTNADATVEAAERRAQDEAVIANEARSAEDAVATLPDAVPSARRRALICERMRRTSPTGSPPAGC